MLDGHLRLVMRPVAEKNHHRAVVLVNVCNERVNRQIPRSGKVGKQFSPTKGLVKLSETWPPKQDLALFSTQFAKRCTIDGASTTSNHTIQCFFPPQQFGEHLLVRVGRESIEWND